jgi:hypothetical protein
VREEPFGVPGEQVARAEPAVAELRLGQRRLVGVAQRERRMLQP